jgi:hypothetical protein
MATISKGIKLSYKAAEGDFVELKDLQEIPDLGGDRDSIEITTLDDAAHMYTDGLFNYGESLAFKFLYDKDQFTTLKDLEGANEWKVALPDGATCTFPGTSNVKFAAAGVNAALTYTLSIRPTGEMVWG